MDGQAVKELAERFRSPAKIDDLIVAPGDWKVHDPAGCVVAAPAAKAFPVATLGAVRDYLAANRDGLKTDTLVVHVESPTRVTVGGPLRERSRDRELYVTATAADLTDGLLGKWLPLEDFIIALQTRFYGASDSRDGLIRLLSNISGESVKTSIDDGISQVVEARMGVVMKNDAVIKNPVLLTPYRTFRDITQQTSAYVLRLKSQGEGFPVVSLMEADGGAWRLATVEAMRTWLVGAIPSDIAVLA